jgi:hypothetical protein
MSGNPNDINQLQDVNRSFFSDLAAHRRGMKYARQRSRRKEAA